MRHLSRFVLVAVSAFAVQQVAAGQSSPAQSRPLRIIAFGAHPDDAELKASGVAALWAAQGAKVKFVAMTNGDVGHFSTAGGPLARRRKAEVAECARILGIENQVLDVHDGELVPSLENRKAVARLIREWQADIVLGHRPYDYHPDHRYTGVILDDTAVVVVAPFFTPDTPATMRNPVYMYYSDAFLKPYPFDPTWSCLSMRVPTRSGNACRRCRRSSATRTRGRRARELASRRRSAAGGVLLDVVKQRSAAVADKYRERLSLSTARSAARRCITPRRSSCPSTDARHRLKS